LEKTTMNAHNEMIADLANRRSFIGGSDARVIMGDDEAALLRLWREKRGEVKPEDLTGNLIVQLGVVTESLNRHSFERGSGQWSKSAASREPAEAELINPEKSLVAMADYEGALLSLWRMKTWRGYFRFGCRGFRSRRPSPPPFSSMNSIPARSKAARIASTAAKETCRRPFSKSTTVESPRLAASASCDCVISNSPRAARHWAGVIGSTFFVDMPPDVSYQ
jgi:hypothetical protein